MGQQKLQEINEAKEESAAPESDLLSYLATRGSASVQGLRQKFSEAFLQALNKKWLVVDEVERERTQRQVYAVRLAGPVPEKPLRLSPVAKRILEALGAEGTGGGPSRTSSNRSSGSCRPQEAKCIGPDRNGACEGRTPLGPTNPRTSAPGDDWAEADASLVLTSAQSTVLDDLTQATGVRTISDGAPPRGDWQREDGSLSPADCPLPRNRPHGSDAGARNCPHPLRAGAVPGPVRVEGGASAQRLIRKRAPRRMVAHSPRRGQSGAGNTLGDLRSSCEPGSGDRR